MDWQEHFCLVSFPSELLEHIWKVQYLECTDICRLACVCSKFNEISSSNDVWKTKFFAGWPQLKQFYPGNQTFDWKKEFISRHKCGQKVQEFVASMSSQFHCKDDISKHHFEDLHMSILELHKLHPEQLAVDELKNLLRDGDIHDNLTQKYYAIKVLMFFQHIILRRRWETLLSQPLEQQALEKGAAMIGQWCQPDQESSHLVVSSRLDALAEWVRTELEKRSTDHPACQALDRDALQEIHKSMWSPQHCRQVLEIINHVLFEQLGFHGNQEDYYNPQNSYIHKVLERKVGIPITLAVVYMAVARRLGVVCEPVNFPMHFLIRWQEHPELEDKQQYTYIDVFNQGRFLAHHECRQLLLSGIVNYPETELFHTVPPKKVFERMCRNLLMVGQRMAEMGDMRSLQVALELATIIFPRDAEIQLLLAKVYINRGVNLMEVIDMLQEIMGSLHTASAGMVAYLSETAQVMIEEERNTDVEPINPKKRSQNREVLYSVGMIMKHKRYDYFCVIYGWDRQCQAGQAWIHKMGVHLLPNKHLQPFYNVLVNDGSSRYAAQESLELAPLPQTISHCEVGKYFHQFQGTHYEPNPETSKQYPDDLQATRQFALDKYS